MTAIAVIFAALALLIGALQYAMPQLTRRDIFFSVTVAPDFRDTREARDILAEYRLGVIAVILITIVPILAVAKSGAELIAAALLMMQLVLTLLLFIRAHRQTRRFMSAPSPQREASLTPQLCLPAMGPLLAGPYLILACAVLMTLSHWDEIPDPMPVHWDFAGNPNGWMPKTAAIFWWTIGSEFATCVIFTFVIVAMLYYSRQIATSGARAREERRFRWIGIATLLAASYLCASLAFLPYSPHATVAFGGVAFFAVILIVGSLEMVRRGQAGARLAPANGDAVIADRTPDACWKWGVLYYNPEDPALLVEKRFGIGWTLNFAHRGAWIFMGLILASLVVSLSLPLLMVYR